MNPDSGIDGPKTSCGPERRPILTEDGFLMPESTRGFSTKRVFVTKEMPQPSRSAPTVFIVDDHPSLLILVVSRLSARGHHCLQSRPDSVVFLAERATSDDQGMIEGHEDQLTLVRAADGREHLHVVLLIAQGERIAWLQAQIPQAILIDRRCPSSHVASTVEEEIARREAA